MTALLEGIIGRTGYPIRSYITAWEANHLQPSDIEQGAEGVDIFNHYWFIRNLR